jgi:hypothetical protein
MEENKNQQPQEEKKSCEAVKTLLKYVIGALLVIGGIALIWAWRGSLWIVVKGCLGLFLVLAGAITIAIAKE